MNRKLRFALLALPLLSVLLGGCTVVLDDDHYHRPHYWYYR